LIKGSSDLTASISCFKPPGGIDKFSIRVT
jgi:hypothetical protein